MTKLFAAFLALLIGVPAFACEDISGLYKVNDVYAVQFKQTHCQSIQIRHGALDLPTGRIDWHSQVVVILDGKSQADGEGASWIGSVGPGGIELTRDNKGFAYTDHHGVCFYNQETFAKAGPKSLRHVQSVFSCDDSFAGTVSETLTSLN